MAHQLAVSHGPAGTRPAVADGRNPRRPGAAFGMRSLACPGEVPPCRTKPGECFDLNAAARGPEEG